MNSRLKGRNHDPRCVVRSALSFEEHRLLDKATCSTLTKSFHHPGRGWRSERVTVYASYEVLLLGLPPGKFRDWDTGWPLDYWLLGKFK